MGANAELIALLAGQGMTSERIAKTIGLPPEEVKAIQRGDSMAARGAATKAELKAMEVTVAVEKATPGTVKYMEVAVPGEPMKLRTLYVTNAAIAMVAEANGIADPAAIVGWKVTLTPILKS